MPRQGRIKTKTGLYHIIIRGINKQDIFYDDQDRKKFLKELVRVKEKYKIQILAYCLMPNHVHLEIKDQSDNVDKMMQSIQVSYSAYFNKKYERIGHLFQNRFVSKCIGDEQYLLSLCRYIHQNPVKARLSTIENYRWSSYSSYIQNLIDNVTDKKIILDLLGNDLKEFKKINLERLYYIDEEEILEYEIKNNLSDEEAIEVLKKKLAIKNISDISLFSKTKREEYLYDLKDIKGISYAQISRILGINKKIIERYYKNCN